VRTATCRNVLLILCDQLRADFLGAYAGPPVTPNIDRLAREGVVFDRAYCACPACAPSRMTMLTGRHPACCPVRIPECVPTVADLLADAGYHTAALGKMHMDPPRGPYGFREIVLSEDTGPGVFLDDFHRWLAGQGHVECSHGLDNCDVLSCRNPLGQEHTVTAWNGATAVDFIRRQRGSTRPFFAVASFVKPHPPYDPPLPWSETVAPADAPRPRGLERPWQDYPEQLRAYADAAGCARVEELGWVQRIRAHYLGLVAQIDNEVGRILTALAEQGLDENTLVLFSADHGDFLGDHHLFMKFWPYDAAGRIPLIVRAPGLAPGRTQAPASHLDFAPTFLDFCGRDIPETCQGRSLLELARGQAETREGVVMKFGGDHGFCLVTRRHKYTVWPSGEEELFDTTKDPEEANNLSAQLRDVRDELRESLVRCLRRFDAERLDPMPALFGPDGLVIDTTRVGAYEGLRRRFMHHRTPSRLD